MDPSVPQWIPPSCPAPTRVPLPPHEEMPPENTIPFLLQLTSEHNVIPQQHHQQQPPPQHLQQVHQQHQQSQQPYPIHFYAHRLEQDHHVQRLPRQDNEPAHGMHRQDHEQVQELQSLHRQDNVQRLNSRDIETQTLSWEEVLRLTIQKFLAHKMSNLIDRHNISGNNCIHIKGLSLEDVLGLVVEHHHKVCLNQDEIPKPATLQTSAHVPVASYTEAEAAASIMIEMLNLQHQSILAQQQANLNDSVDINFDPNQLAQPSPPKKQPRKKSFAPVENTKEELVKRNVKIIRCDPPEEVMRQQKMGKIDKGPDGKRKHIPAKKWFQCAECGKKMEDISKLSRHSALHTDLRPYKCPICQKSYKTRDMLNKHRKVHLPREQVWKVSCPYCNKRFASRPERDKHIVIHTGERNKKCQECGETFRNATTLKQHRLRKHGLGKSVKCPFCECTGVTKSRLSSHVVGVHKAQMQKIETGILICPHKCLVCNEEFSDEAMLVEHMLDHGKGDCSTCKSRQFRHVRLKAHARRLGLKPPEIDEKDIDELADWVKEEKKRKTIERENKKAEEVYKNAVARGMNPEEAKDNKAAIEYLKQFDTVKKNKVKTEAEAREDAERVREYLRRHRGGKPGWNKRITKEDLPYAGGDAKLVSDLKAEIEQLKRNLNQSAMEIALDIIEEINVEDVVEQSSMQQEMALIKAELQARKKKGNVQNTLAKKIMGEKIDEDENVLFKTTTPEVNEGQLCEADETGDSRDAIMGQVSKLMSAAEVGKLLRPKVTDSEGSTDPKDLTCTVYSQSPRDTLRMIKQGRITYVFIPSSSSRLYATHMRSKPTQASSIISQKIFVNTDDPEAVKLELLAGQLKMKIVPLVLKKPHVKEEEDTSASSSKETPTRKSKRGPSKGPKPSHIAVITEPQMANIGVRKRPIRSKAVLSYLILEPTDADASEDTHYETCTLYSPDPEASIEMIKSGQVQFFVSNSNSPGITARHLLHAASRLSKVINICGYEPEDIKLSHLRLKVVRSEGGKAVQTRSQQLSKKTSKGATSTGNKSPASPKRIKIKLPAKTQSPVTKGTSVSPKGSIRLKRKAEASSPVRAKRSRLLKSGTSNNSVGKNTADVEPGELTVHVDHKCTRKRTGKAVYMEASNRKDDDKLVEMEPGEITDSSTTVLENRNGNDEPSRGKELLNQDSNPKSNETGNSSLSDSSCNANETGSQQSNKTSSSQTNLNDSSDEQTDDGIQDPEAQILTTDKQAECTEESATRSSENVRNSEEKQIAEEPPEMTPYISKDMTPSTTTDNNDATSNQTPSTASEGNTNLSL